MSDEAQAPLLSDDQAADEYVAGRGFKPRPSSSGANADDLMALLFAEGEARVAFKAGAAWQHTRDVQELESLRARLQKLCDEEHIPLPVDNLGMYCPNHAEDAFHEGVDAAIARVRGILEGESQGEGSGER